MPVKIEIAVEVDEEELLESLLNSLLVETSNDETKRGTFNLTKKENCLMIEIFAEDQVAARSLSNSLLRLLKTSVDVSESIKII